MVLAVAVMVVVAETNCSYFQLIPLAFDSKSQLLHMHHGSFIKTTMFFQTHSTKTFHYPAYTLFNSKSI